MVLNPAYAGKRVFRGDVVGAGQWEPLVPEELFWACARLLGDPKRTTTRPGRAKYLVSHLGVCDECGGSLQGMRARRARGDGRPAWEAMTYRYAPRACSAVGMAELDEYVSRTVVAWLSREDVFQALTAGGDDQAVAEARAEAARLRSELEQWRQAAEANEVTVVSFARAEKGLLAGIDAAEARAAEAGVPPVLHGRIGVQAVPAWEALADDVAVKREIIRVVAEIRLKPAGKGRKVDLSDRVVWRWTLADNAA